jgi:hypothetical protein
MEIDQRVNQGPFDTNSIIRTILSALIGAILLAAWIIGYLKPLLERNQELAALDNKILRCRK